jgi:hypothetical protein
VDFFKQELQNAKLERRDPDPTFFTKHPDTGYALPRNDAFEKYAKLQDRQALNDLSIPTEEVTPPNTNEDLNTALNYFDEHMKNDGFELEDGEPMVARGWKFIQENKDPRFWDGDRLKTDAFLIYASAYERPRLAEIERDFYKGEMEKSLATEKAELQKLWEERNHRPTMPTLASTAGAETRPGSEVTLPTPDEYKNPLVMMKIINVMAEQHGISFDEAFNRVEARIKQLPEGRREPYYRP